MVLDRRRSQAAILARQIRSAMAMPAKAGDTMLLRLLEAALANCNAEIHGDIEIEIGTLFEAADHLRDTVLRDLESEGITVSNRWIHRSVKERILLRKCYATLRAARRERPRDVLN